jgi:hypothetical protein
MYEITLTKRRHEIVSPITGEIVKESFFGNTVEDVLNVEKHMVTVTERFAEIDDEDIIVYVTGLTTLVQAVFAAWLSLRCSGVTQSLDMPRGRLTFAHFNRDSQSYDFANALTGSNGVHLEWYENV